MGAERSKHEEPSHLHSHLLLPRVLPLYGYLHRTNGFLVLTAVLNELLIIMLLSVKISRTIRTALFINHRKNVSKTVVAFHLERMCQMHNNDFMEART